MGGVYTRCIDTLLVGGRIPFVFWRAQPFGKLMVLDKSAPLPWGIKVGVFVPEHTEAGAAFSFFTGEDVEISVVVEVD